MTGSSEKGCTDIFVGILRFDALLSLCLHFLHIRSKALEGASSTLGMFGLFMCWVLHGLLEQGGSFLLALTGHGSRACFCEHSGGEYGILDCLKELGTRGLYMLMWCTVADLRWGCPS